MIMGGQIGVYILDLRPVAAAVFKSSSAQARADVVGTRSSSFKISNIRPPVRKYWY